MDVHKVNGGHNGNPTWRQRYNVCHWLGSVYSLVLIQCYEPESYWYFYFLQGEIGRKISEGSKVEKCEICCILWTWRWTLDDSNWFEAWHAYTQRHRQMDGPLLMNSLVTGVLCELCQGNSCILSLSEGSVLAWERFFSSAVKEAPLAEKNSARLREWKRCRGVMLCIHFLQAESIWCANQTVKRKSKFLCWGIHWNSQFRFSKKEQLSHVPVQWSRFARLFYLCCTFTHRKRDAL